jgi:hypothetical protein
MLSPTFDLRVRDLDCIGSDTRVEYPQYFRFRSHSVLAMEPVSLSTLGSGYDSGLREQSHYGGTVCRTGEFGLSVTIDGKVADSGKELIKQISLMLLNFKITLSAS